MSKVVCDVAVTVDGYVSGRGQTRENPFPPLNLEIISARSASLVTHVTYRVHH